MNVGRTNTKIPLGFAVLIVLSNFFPIKAFFEIVVDEYHYQYSNGDGKWKFTERRIKGSTFNFRRTFTEAAKREMPGADTIIYRNFTKNPFAFWRYRDYLTNPIYTLPYKSRKDLPKVAN